MSSCLWAARMAPSVRGCCRRKPKVAGEITQASTCYRRIWGVWGVNCIPTGARYSAYNASDTSKLKESTSVYCVWAALTASSVSTTFQMAQKCSNWRDTRMAWEPSAMTCTFYLVVMKTVRYWYGCCPWTIQPKNYGVTPKASSL